MARIVTAPRTAAGLRAEIERLERKVEALEQALYGGAGLDYAPAFTHHAGVLLSLLMARPVVAFDQMTAALEAEDPTADGRPRGAVQVIVSQRIRPVIRPHGADVRSRRGVGYWMSPDDKSIVRALVDGGSRC